TLMFKSHEGLVHSFEFLIAVFSLLSMLPCLFIIAKTGTLHPNCKSLLICSATVQIQIIAIQIVVVLYDYFSGIDLRDDVGEEAWFMFAHEIGYGISTMLSVYLVVER
ncbi:hypothetical protein PFISCL1PPCAC_12679, partial [Pristionchus fissidentatus]